MSNDKFFTRKSSCCDCCGKRVIGFRPVRIGGCCLEIEGLDDVFEEYSKGGKVPEDRTGDQLVFDLRKLNFIPEDAEDLYKEAFLREYRSYLKAKGK